MKCFLWSHYTEFQHENTESNASYENFNVLEGHKNAVLDCAWCDEDCLVTCSADKTVMLWDATTGKRLRKWAEHTAVVNAVDRGVNETQVVSASDDRTCLVWDRRQKRPSGTLEAQFPVLAVAASAEHQQIYTSGIDPKIYAWDVRRLEHPLFAMSGHTDTVTSLAVHPHHDTHLLSNSMDQSLRSWDIRPFAGGTGSSNNSKRHYKTFQGHTHSAEKGRRAVFRLSGWIRRHMRKFMWQRWHSWRGRYNALRRLGALGPKLALAHSTRGAWRTAVALNPILTNGRLRRWGLYTPEDLAAASSS